MHASSSKVEAHGSDRRKPFELEGRGRPRFAAPPLFRLTPLAEENETESHGEGILELHYSTIFPLSYESVGRVTIWEYGVGIWEYGGNMGICLVLNVY